MSVKIEKQRPKMKKTRAPILAGVSFSGLVQTMSDTKYFVVVENL